MVPRLEFRVSVPLLIAITGAGIVAVIAHYRWPDARKTIEFAAALVGGGTAVYALMLNVQARRAAAAAEFIKRYNSPDFERYRTEMGKALRNNTVERKDIDLNLIRTALSFYEEMAISILRKEADEELLKEFFYTAAVRLYAASKDWIEKRRTENHQPTFYSQYQKVHDRWAARPLGVKGT